MMDLLYTMNPKIHPKEVAEVFRRSGIPRPVDDTERIKRMIENANLIVCARDGKRLVGIARALTDHCFCCYVSDLAVDREYQGKGIGKALLRRIKSSQSEEVMILLLSLPGAHAYYPHIGFKKENHAWVIRRKR
jgi:predicted N-acetyltransferase YhbS